MCYTQDMKPFPLPPLPAAQLERLMVQHHLEGLYSFYFPDQTTSDFLNRYKQQWIHNETLLAEVEHLGKLAEKKALNAVVLKGIDLLLNLYEDNGLRFMSDIDLLVEEKDLDDWEIILREESFTPVAVSDFGGKIHKKDWRKMAGEIEINLEIHTRLFYNLENDLWETGPSPVQGLSQLKREDLFVHLAGHLAFQHTFSRLNWTLDLFYFYQKWSDKIDWQVVRQKAREKRLMRSVQMTLWILQTHFSLPVGTEVKRLFALDKKSWWKNWLSFHFLLYPQKNLFHFLIVKHATKDTFTEALRYDCYWMTGRMARMLRRLIP